MEEHHDMCMRREELEFSTEEEVANNDAYVAPPVNRFRTNYKLLHMMQTSWSLETENSLSLRFHASGGQSPDVGIFRETNSTDARRLLQRGG